MLPEITQIIEHCSAGPCLALEVRQENCVEMLRALFGPYDPTIAKELRPDSLRARYGLNRVKNVAHVTDLEEDGSLEVNYYLNEILRL